MNRGAQRLRKALKRGDQAELARKLKVDPAAVSKWLKGTHTPDAKFRAGIEDEYGIGWRLWDQKVSAS
jgi:transcriptional regulator with XRE-family HTH domain